MDVSVKDNTLNDKLLSRLILAYLTEDDFSYSIINTRLLNRLNEGELTLDDLVLVYNFIDTEYMQ